MWISDSINFFWKTFVPKWKCGYSQQREAEFVYVQFFMFIRKYGYNSYSLLNVVNTSRGPNRGVGGGEYGCVCVTFLITASFGYFKTLKAPANYCQVCNFNFNTLLGRSQVRVPQKFYLLGRSRGQVFQILASASYICLYTMSNTPVGIWSKINEPPNTGGECRLPVMWGRLVMGLFIDHKKFCPCRKQAFCLQSCPLWLVCTIVFIQQNLLSLC